MLNKREAVITLANQETHTYENRVIDEKILGTDTQQWQRIRMHVDENSEWIHWEFLKAKLQSQCGRSRRFAVSPSV